ncbi:MAG: hybrid sensor histidine kinase/response regulator, partial [Bacteroidota bacterium]
MELQIFANIELSSFYSYLKDEVPAFKYVNKATELMEVAKQQPDFEMNFEYRRLECMLLGNRASINKWINTWETKHKAVDLYDEFLAKKCTDCFASTTKASYYRSIGSLYNNMDVYDNDSIHMEIYAKAQGFLRKAMRIQEGKGFWNEYAMTLGASQSVLYAKRLDLPEDIAIDSANYAIDKALEMVEDSENQWLRLSLMRTKSGHLYFQGKMREAFLMSSRALSQQHKLANETRSNSIAYLHVQSETAEKEKTIAQQSLQIAKQQNRNNLIVIGALALLLISGTIFGLYYFQSRQKVMKAEKEKAINEARSKFFANISHEFRTPLTLILNGLKDTNASGGIELNKTDTDIIQRNANRLQQLIEQLLDVSKIEAGKMVLNATEGNFSRYLKGLVGTFQSLAAEKQINLQFYQQPKDIRAPFDRDKTDKIFYNLLGNALKFTSAGGDVQVRIGTEQQEVLVEITDTGIGIPEEELPHIFDRFHRAKQKDEYAYEGSGIGLALVRELVELHGGSIEVVSDLHKGSSFFVRLPGSETEALTNQSPPLESAATTSAKTKKTQYPDKSVTFEPIGSNRTEKPMLLLIEDNDDLRYDQRKRLVREYEIMEAAEGDIGLSLAQQHIPDLIICDL